jgi:hypothetical protein
MIMIGKTLGYSKFKCPSGSAPRQKLTQNPTPFRRSFHLQFFNQTKRREQAVTPRYLLPITILIA